MTDFAPFADLLRRSCLSRLDLQLAIAGEFGRADAVATHGLLDDHARALFALPGRDPETQALALMRVMTSDLRFAARAGEPGDLLLPQVLRTRRGHPLTLAIIACELALRAGIGAGVYSSQTRWFVGLRGERQLLLLDAALAGDDHAPAQVLAHCPHELAYCTLTGLSRGFADRDELPAARRAATLKLALPLGDGIRAEVQRELDALARPPRHPRP